MRGRRAGWGLTLVALSLAACRTPALPDELSRANVDASIAAWSGHVHRGLPLLEGEVLVADVRVASAERGTGLGLALSGVLDLSGARGGRLAGEDGLARFEGSLFLQRAHAGLDWSVFVTRRSFAGRGLPDTSELGLSLSSALAGLEPRLLVAFDVDEVDGAWARAELVRRMPLPDGASLALEGACEVIDDDEAALLFGVGESGWARVQVGGELSWPLTRGLRLQTRLVFERVPAKAYADALRDDGLSPAQALVSLGLAADY